MPGIMLLYPSATDRRSLASCMVYPSPSKMRLVAPIMLAVSSGRVRFLTDLSLDAPSGRVACTFLGTPDRCSASSTGSGFQQLSSFATLFLCPSSSFAVSFFLPWLVITLAISSIVTQNVTSSTADESRSIFRSLSLIVDQNNESFFSGTRRSTIAKLGSGPNSSSIWLAATLKKTWGLCRSSPCIVTGRSSHRSTNPASIRPSTITDS